MSNTGEINPRRASSEIIADNPSIGALIKNEEELTYVKEMESQHFRSKRDPEAAAMGSVIYNESVPGPLETLELIADKLGKDDAQDRQDLLAAGAPAASLLDFAKYYKVSGLSGEMRVISVKDLPEDQIVTVKPSPKGTPSIVIDEADAPNGFTSEVDYATVIVGPREGGGDTVWTMHAGHPVPMIPIARDSGGKPVKDTEGRLILPPETGLHYGQIVPVSEVKRILGPDTYISIETIPDDNKQEMEAVHESVQAGIEAITGSVEGEFYYENGGSILKVDLVPSVEQVNMEGTQYSKKLESHMTLVPSRMNLDKIVKTGVTDNQKIVNLLVSAGLTPEEAQTILEKGPSNKQYKEATKLALVAAAEGLTFKVRPRDEYRLAEKGDSKTVIQICDVEGADQYYRNLESLLGLPTGHIISPPHHVTLFTGENGKAIGLVSEEELNEFTRPVAADVVKAAL